MGGTVAGLYEDGFGFADGIGTAIVGEGEGDVFVGASCHFVRGAGIVVGEGHEMFDGCDGVVVVGEGRGGGVFRLGLGGVLGY